MMTTLHQRTETYKAGWVRGFYDCRNDEGMACGSPAAIPDGPDRERQTAEYWSGYFDGRAAGRGRISVKRPLETGAAERGFSLTLYVLAQFANGSSIESIAGEMKTGAARVEVRLRGVFAAMLRFLAERSESFKTPDSNNFEQELLALAFCFGSHGREGNRRGQAA